MTGHWGWGASAPPDQGGTSHPCWLTCGWQRCPRQRREGKPACPATATAAEPLLLSKLSPGQRAAAVADGFLFSACPTRKALGNAGEPKAAGRGGGKWGSKLQGGPGLIWGCRGSVPNTGQWGRRGKERVERAAQPGPGGVGNASSTRVVPLHLPPPLQIG